MTLLTLILACSSAPEPAEPAPEPAPVEAPAPEPEPEPEAAKPDYAVKKHMDARFAFATDALWRGFMGDLEGLKEDAAKLPDPTPLPNAPKSWDPWVKKLHQQSSDLQKVEDLDQASRDLVKIAATCADCHQENNGPKVTEADLNIGPAVLDSAMDRHQWSIYMMWIGLIAPNDEIWVKGAKTFGHDRKALPGQPETLAKLEGQVHDLAARAASAKPEQRGEVFAELITSCAECHQEAGVELK